MPPHIQRILELTGPALLLPWSKGSKGGKKRWGHLALALMDDRVHQSRLEKAGNIGVALGNVSGGLITVDLDSEEHAAAFLGANPALRDTLRTKGKRGCNVWVRMDGDYPGTHKLKDKAGNEIGEFRSTGAQTIIWGTHPDGMAYVFEVEKPAISVAFEKIVFGCSRQQNGQVQALTVIPTETQRRLRYRDAETTKTKKDVCVGGLAQSAYELAGIPREILNFKNIVGNIAPRTFHQTNSSLFNLGRLNKAFEIFLGKKTTPKQKNRVFDLWCESSRPFWTKTRESYFVEFVRLCETAKVGLDQDVLRIAYIRSSLKPLPAVVGFSDERVRRLAGMCRELHLLLEGHPFFLPTRKVAELLGADFRDVANWIRTLESFGYIALAHGEIHKQGGSRSPRYVYIFETQLTGS